MGPRQEGCIFCDAWKADPKDALVVGKSEFSFGMLNKYPYTNGHLLIAPYRHVSDVEALTHDEAVDLMLSVRKAIMSLKEAYHPEGLNLGMNLGRVAGAGVEDHLHFHVVPRWKGDTNFMSVCVSTRVVSEGLDSTWKTLAPLFGL